MMSKFDYPLLFDPIPVPKVWGGRRLSGLRGTRAAVGGAPIGESWDVSTWPAAPDNAELVTVTSISNGPLAGTPLDEVADVPVVVKAIDSGEKLSVQNHPVLPDVHKNEMWYILQSDPGSYLYLGLRDGVSQERFCAALRQAEPDENELLGMLVRYDEPLRGSFFNVPTGTVHALGPGLLTFEISERSQVTYRLYDYNRERSRGKLDIEDGCAAIRAIRQSEPPLDPRVAIEADTTDTITVFPSFCVIRAAGDRVRVTSADRIHLVTATRGDCHVRGSGEHWDIRLPETMTCLMPPTAAGYEIDSGGSGEILISPLGGS